MKMHFEKKWQSLRVALLAPSPTLGMIVTAMSRIQKSLEKKT
jgi:hypothetical protein